MNKTERIKRIILMQYPSIRAFAAEVGIPHGTVVSALNNGIEGMSYGKVVKICRALQIDCETFEPIPADVEDMSSSEKRLLAYYKLLDERKKNKVLEYIEDIG